MRVLIFVQTTIIILFNVGACFATTLHKRRNERTETKDASQVAATTNIVLKRAETSDEVDGKNKSSFNGKNGEARGNELVDFLSQSAVHMIDWNLEKGIEIQELSTRLKNELMHQSGGSVATMMEHVHWRTMTQKAYDWLKEAPVHPKTVFSYLNLQSIFHQGTNPVTMGHDPKLILWFSYIKEYRSRDTTGSNYAAFNNRELLEFLAAHIQPLEGSKLTFPLHDPSLFDQFSQAVKLFDFYRRERILETFATDMLTYMVTDSVTKDLVLKEWLLHKESPKTIFKVLSLKEKHAPIGIDDVALFTAWLDYIKMYLNLEDCDFNLGRFVHHNLPAMSMPRAKVMFESNALENVLGDVEYHTQNLAANVRDMWQRFPEDTFRRLELLGRKITPDAFPNFARAISSVASYVESRPFNGDQVFDLLNPEHSFDEVVYLFQKLKRTAQSIRYLEAVQRKIVRKYARSMVQYLSDFSSMLKLSEPVMHPELILGNLISNNAQFPMFRMWFKYFVAYYRRVEKKSIGEAITNVILLLKKKLPIKSGSRDSWQTIVGRLQREDARIKSALESLKHSRPRET